MTAAAHKEALAVLATACSPAYAGADRGTIAPKPKGPVTQKHLVRSGCSPHREAGFCHAQILGASAPVALAQWLRGVVGPTRKDGRTASDVFLTTTPHPLHSKMQTVALVTPEGAKTMTATPVASASARTSTTNAPTEEERAYALLQALSSASLARLYLHKNNVPAARRQAVLLLKTLQTLEAA